MIPFASHRSAILVIDDEPQIRRLLRLVLEAADYTVREAATGHAGLTEAVRHKPDAIILDFQLPDMNGLDVLKQLRSWNAVPVVMLSVADHEANTIAALDAGADDYLPKPFAAGELLARLRARLRAVKPNVPSNLFRFGTVEIDFTCRRVTKAGRPVDLTPTEYALLKLFIVRRDQVITHRQIFDELWGPDALLQTNYLRTYMLRLRRKLEENVDAPQFFQTEFGVGYRFVSESDDVASLRLAPALEDDDAPLEAWSLS